MKVDRVGKNIALGASWWFSLMLAFFIGMEQGLQWTYPAPVQNRAVVLGLLSVIVTVLLCVVVFSEDK